MDDNAIERLVTRGAHREMLGKWMRVSNELAGYTRYLEARGYLPDAESEPVAEYVAGISEWMNEVGRMFEIELNG